MGAKFLSIILLICFATSGKTQISYSDAALQDFVNVYMTFKTEKKKNLKPQNELLTKYNVSQKRYHEISKAALTHDKLTLNPNEEQLIQEIKNQNDLLDLKNNELLEKMCLENEISIKVYNEIFKGYTNDIIFQRSLKPYFDNYIKGLK